MGAGRIIAAIVGAALLAVALFGVGVRMQIIDTGYGFGYGTAIANPESFPYPSAKWCTVSDSTSKILTSSLVLMEGGPVTVTRVDLWVSTPVSNTGTVTLTVAFAGLNAGPTSGALGSTTIAVPPGFVGGYVTGTLGGTGLTFGSPGVYHYFLRVTAQGNAGNRVNWHEGVYEPSGDKYAACAKTPYVWQPITSPAFFAYRVFGPTGGSPSPGEITDTTPPATDGDGMHVGNRTYTGNDTTNGLLTEPVVIGALLLFGVVIVAIAAASGRRRV